MITYLLVVIFCFVAGGMTYGFLVRRFPECFREDVEWSQEQMEEQMKDAHSIARRAEECELKRQGEGLDEVSQLVAAKEYWDKREAKKE